jgi:integrase
MMNWAGGREHIEGTTTKSGKTRHVPIFAERLRSVFQWLRLDREGNERPAGARVFGDEDGKPISSFRRAWWATVLKAHGVKTQWTRTPAQEGEKRRPSPRRRARLSSFYPEWCCGDRLS